MMAVNEGSSDIAKLLIAHRADVNAVDNNEMTALVIACEKGNVNMVETLLKAGADVNKKSKYGDTALSKAILSNNVQIVKMLVKKSGNFNKHDALFSAVSAGNLEIVKFLLTKDVDVNMRFFAGQILLMFAVDKNFEIVKFLIERGADVNKKDDEGKTSLMNAVESFNEANISSIKYLIAHGADVKAVNNKGETALILAVKRGNAEMVRILTEKKSPVSLKDKTGKSAWTYAVEGANPAVVKLLEKAGAARVYLGMEWKGNISNQKEKFVKAVGAKEEWSELWKRTFDKQAPDIDFENYVVACVFLGHSADWLYSIGFGQSFMRDNQLVIPYGLYEVMLRLAGPFKAGGQYHMKVFEKKKNVKIILEESKVSSSRY
jgi:ankyrin repeat protein